MPTYEGGVTLRYTGTNRGAITFLGTDRKRSYRVATGWQGSAHPDDAERLLALGKFEVVEVAEEPATRGADEPPAGDQEPEEVPPGGSESEDQPGAPIEGYDDMTVEEVEAALPALGVDELNVVKSYEAAHKNRVGVLRAIDAATPSEA